MAEIFLSVVSYNDYHNLMAALSNLTFGNTLDSLRQRYIYHGKDLQTVKLSILDWSAHISNFILSDEG